METHNSSRVVISRSRSAELTVMRGKMAGISHGIVLIIVLERTGSVINNEQAGKVTTNIFWRRVKSPMRRKGCFDSESAQEQQHNLILPWYETRETNLKVARSFLRGKRYRVREKIPLLDLGFTPRWLMLNYLAKSPDPHNNNNNKTPPTTTHA